MRKKISNNFDPEEYNTFEDQIMDKINFSDYKSEENLLDDLEKSRFHWRKVQLKDNSVIVIRLEGGKKEYVIEYDDDYIESKEIMDWFYEISDYDLSYYVDYEEENFWEDAVYPGMILYHATDCKNIPSIKMEGLNPRSDSRAKTNKMMPAAVFTSSNPHVIDSYGDCVIGINVGQMKTDGYMPEVRREEGMDEAQMRVNLAAKMGIENIDIEYELNQGMSQGLSEETVVFLGNIPPKYLNFSGVVEAKGCNWYRKADQSETSNKDQSFIPDQFIETNDIENPKNKPIDKVNLECLIKSRYKQANNMNWYRKAKIKNKLRDIYGIMELL